MKLKMSFEEWYREVVKLMTQEGATPPSQREARGSYDAGISPQESAQQFSLSQTKWDEQAGDDPFIK